MLVFSLTAIADAQPRVTLPAGVKSVAFGPGASIRRAGERDLRHRVAVAGRGVRAGHDRNVLCGRARAANREAAPSARVTGESPVRRFAPSRCNVLRRSRAVSARRNWASTHFPRRQSAACVGPIHAPHQRRRPDSRCPVQHQITSDPIFCMYPRALLLDLDDTILDDSSLVYECWRDACADHAAQLALARRGGARRCDSDNLEMVLGRSRSASHGTAPARSGAARRRAARAASSSASKTRELAACNRRRLQPQARCWYGAAA